MKLTAHCRRIDDGEPIGEDLSVDDGLRSRRVGDTKKEHKRERGKKD